MASATTNYLQREFISHTRRVCSLYKRMFRDCIYWEEDFFEARFKQLKLRAEFDKNKNIADLRVAKAILNKAEYDFKTFKQHPYHALSVPYHPYSKDGIAHGRNREAPDHVMDAYHPLEKAQYPYYFAKREQMKIEYLKLWKKKMIKPEVKEVGGGHH